MVGGSQAFVVGGACNELQFLRETFRLLGFGNEHQRPDR